MAMPTNTTSILVDRVYPPKGRGPAAVKDGNTGAYFKFWSRTIPVRTFNEGETYEIAFHTEDYRGEDQFYIDSIVGESPVATSSGKDPSWEIARRAGAKTSHGPSVAGPMPAMDKSEDIAVLAIVKCMGVLPIGDPAVVCHALRTAQSAWRLYKKGNIETGRPERMPEPPIQDEIPEEFR